MNEKRSILIVANPVSNRGQGARLAGAVAARLREMGVAVTIEHTTSRGDAERIALGSAGGDPRYDCIVACGGDGTVQEVANALAQSIEAGSDTTPALGLAPAGRCNDFARALGIPPDPRAIAEVLAHGKARPVDLGKVNGRYFCTVATAGIDAEISRFVDTMRTPLRGTAAYIYGAIRVLMRYRAPAVRVEGDFGTFEGRFFLTSSANTSSYGGAIPIAPGATPTDGLLDVCMLKEVSKLRAITLVPAIVRGRHLSEPEVRLVQCKSLTIETEEPMELWADGERIAHTPAHIEVVPAAIRVILSKDPQPNHPGAENTIGT